MEGNMAEGKKKRPKVIVIILIAVAVVFHVIGLIKIIPEISKDIKERKEIEASVSLARANRENDDHDSYTTQTAPITPPVATAPAVASMPDDTRNNVLTEVPDHIANRGIILRGDDYRESGQSFRGTTHSDTRWYYDYVTDCNLMIEGTDQDFEAFVRRFGDEVSFPEAEPGYPAYYCGEIVFEHLPRVDQNIFIYRTEYITWDCSDGKREMPEYPDRTTPVFYDPSGRYVFDMTYGSECEDLLIKFLEPVMTRIEVTRPGETVPDFATNTVNPDVIGLYIDAMHDLYANEKNMDASEVLASGEVTKISFTTENGVVHDYYLVDGNYLVYNGQVYYVRNCQSLQTLLADKTLFYIDGV